MKINKIIVLGLVLTLGLSVVGTSSTDAQTPPGSTPPGGTFDQRIAQRKQERNIKIDERDQRRLTSRCVQTQGKIRILQQTTTKVLTNRTKVYQRVDGKLWAIIGQLKLAERDTFELEKQRANLTGKTSTFQTTATSYQQVLDDMVVINCQADIVGFKSLLETARIYQGQLRSQSSEIRSYVVNDIKKNLAGHAAEMRPKPASDGVQ